jgi:crotonobetainyl-CoA:carnitine CoA-transferase CaiB-like acyl-CoA transferase
MLKKGALSGLKVLEFANYITGPYASMLLADIGAEVIKVEIPGSGDPFRGWGDAAYSPTFCGFNRNKKSITLNVSSKEGKKIFEDLVEDTDVLIENFRPGVLDEMGFGYEQLRIINPKLIYCSITGFGSDGPYRDRPGYDTIGQAMGGLLGVLIDLDKPSGIGAPLSDLLTGLYACYAIQGALLSRYQTGLGQKVETSLLQATVAFGSSNASTFLASGLIPNKSTRTQMAQVYVFTSGDGLPFVIHLSSPQKFWHSLTKALNKLELAEDERFCNRELRFKNYHELTSVLQEIFKSGTRSKWLSLLEKHDVPVAAILNQKEVFEDPQVMHLGMVVEMNHKDLGPVRLVKSAINMSETPPKMSFAPPALGEHTQEILEKLGYSIDDFKTLKLNNVI